MAGTLGKLARFSVSKFAGFGYAVLVGVSGNLIYEYAIKREPALIPPAAAVAPAVAMAPASLAPPAAAPAPPAAVAPAVVQAPAPAPAPMPARPAVPRVIPAALL